MKKSIAAILMALMLLPAAAALAGATGSDGELAITGNASFTPTELDASIVVEAPVSNVTSLDGNGSFTISNGSLLGELNLTAGLVGLENVSASLYAKSRGNISYDAASGQVIADSLQVLRGSLLAVSNGSVFNASINLTQNAETAFSTVMRAGTDNKTYSLEITVSVSGDAYTYTFTLDMSGQETGIISGNTTTVTGSASGTLYVDMGAQYQLDYTLDYEYTINASSGQVNLSATASIDANDYATALQIYTALNALVAQFNLSDYVTVQPPSFTNPVVTVVVQYSGTLNITAPLGPGMGNGAGLPQGLGDIALLLPTDLSNESVNATYCGKVQASLENNTLQLYAKITASASPVPQSLAGTTAEGTLTVSYDPDRSVAIARIDVSASGMPEPFTAFAALKSAVSTLAEDMDHPNGHGNMSINLTLTLTASDGVTLYYHGQEYSSVTISNSDNLSSLALRYGDLVYYDPGRIVAVGENVTLPIASGTVILNGTNRIVASLPYPAKLAGNLTLKAPEKARVTVLSGDEITGLLVFGAEPVGPDAVPSEYSNLTPIGPAVVVKNVTGSLWLKVKIDSNATGSVALLIIHDNGTTSLYTNVSVSNGCLVATVPASSTFIPVALSGTGGGNQTTGTNTTTETTSSGTTTGGTATTTTETSTVTTTKQTTTTGEPGETQTTTTGQQPGETGTTTEPGEEQGGLNTTIIAVIAALIVVGVAVALLKR